MSTPALEVRDVTKAFGPVPAVDGVSLTLAEGDVLALLGPSGSGKSTLLGLIAGLDAPDAGDILWQGQSLSAVPIHARGFGLMFQDYALFPHKDVAANVGFGLRMQGKSRAAIRAGVTEALSEIFDAPAILSKVLLQTRDAEESGVPERLGSGKELPRDAKNGMDELTLADRVTLRDPADLAFSDCMHRLVPLNRSTRAVQKWR